MSKLSAAVIVSFFKPDDGKILNKGREMSKDPNIFVISFMFSGKTIQSTIRSSHKKASAYKVKITLDDKLEKVITASCQCKVGRSRCSHMATTLYYAETVISKTSCPVSWIKPPVSAATLMKNTQTIDDLFNSGSSSNSKLCPVVMQSVEVSVEADGAENDTYTTEEVVEDFSAGRDLFYRKIISISPSIGVAQLLSPEPDISSLPLEKWKHLLLYPALKNTKSIGDAIRVITSMRNKMENREINALQLDTVGQFTSVLYCSIKKLRITSTHFQEVLAMVKRGKRKIKKSLTSLSSASETAKEKQMKCLLFPSNKDTFVAVQWGIHHEETAKRDFETLTDLKVTDSGIFLDKSVVLGASPDGLVDDDCLLEIKCLFGLKDVSIKDHITNHVAHYSYTGSREVTCIPNMRFLKCGSSMSSVVMNKNHKYYHQIQAQLHFSGRQKCYLFLWSSIKPHYCVEVEKDPSYTSTIEIIRSFYLEEYLPYIVKQIKEENTLVYCEATLNVVNTDDEEDTCT